MGFWDSRWIGPLDEGSGDDTKDNTRGRRQGAPTDWVDSPVRKEEAEQPPPGSGASGRQLSPAPGKRLKLASPRSTEHHHRHLDSPCSTEHHHRHLDSPCSTEHHRQSSRDRNTHTNNHSALASEVALAQQALNDAKVNVLRREACRRRRGHDEDAKQAKAAAREASLVLERARRALAAATGATAAPSYSTRPGCRFPAPTAQGRRFYQGKRRAHGVCTEGRVLLSVRDRGGGNGLRPPHAREAGVAGRGPPFSGGGLGSHGLYVLFRQTRSAPTLALVKALPMAHDEAPDLAFWSTPEE